MRFDRLGLSPYDRERLVLERTNIISEILDTEEYRKYRQAKLSTYTAQLKSILGPLLDKDANRQDAGAELNSVVLVA